MALYTTRGRISEMSEVQTGTSKNGYAWQRMTLLLDVPGYQGSVTKQCFQVSGDDVNEVSLFNVGDKVEIQWSMYAREWNGRWYNNVELVKIALQDGEKTGQAKTAKVSESQEEDLIPENHQEDLPF